MRTCCHDGCRAPATHWLIHPDGTRNPGGWVCERHGREIVEEYRAKLQEAWTMQRLGAADE